MAPTLLAPTSHVQGLLQSHRHVCVYLYVQGSFTVLASETHALVGVDVSAPGQVVAKGGTTLLASLRARFADSLDDPEVKTHSCSTHCQTIRDAGPCVAIVVQPRRKLATL